MCFSGNHHCTAVWQDLLLSLQMVISNSGFFNRLSNSWLCFCIVIFVTQIKRIRTNCSSQSQPQKCCLIFFQTEKLTNNSFSFFFLCVRAPFMELSCFTVDMLSQALHCQQFFCLIPFISVVRFKD